MLARCFPCLAVITLLLGATVPARAAILNIIAKEGDQIGGGPLSALGPPAVNDVGVLVFSATRSFTASMIVKRDVQGAFSIVVESGAAAPGTTGALFGLVGNKLTTLNESGQVLFDGSLQDGVGDASDAAHNRDGVWLTNSGGLALVARDRNSIPGGSLHYDIVYAFPLLADDGRVAFEAYSLEKTQNTSAPDTMVLGTPPTMNGVDTSSEGFILGDLYLGPTGGFWTAATGEGLQRRYFVHTTNGGTPTTLVQDGDAAPGGGVYQSTHVTDVNASGTYVGGAFIGTPQFVGALLIGQPGAAPTVLFKVGDALPGDAGTLAAFVDNGGPLIADDGSVTFVALADEKSGLFRIKGASKSAIAVDGDQVPGLAAGIVFSEIAGHTVFSMNSVGQVAFLTRIAGPGLSFGTSALFLADDDGTVHFITRTGNTIVLGPNMTDVISHLDVASFWLSSASLTGGTDGHPRWLTDDGRVAFSASYESGFSNAVIVAEIGDGGPTPTPMGGATKTPTPQPTATASFADKGPVKCRAAIAGSSEALVTAETKAAAACLAKIVGGKLPVGTNCRTETKAAGAIAKAQTKLRTAVAKACGGKDKTCGAGGDDVGLALIGWNVDTCPGAKDGSCGTAIADCDGIATCATCIGETLVDRALGVATGAFVQTDPKDKAQKPLNKCQAAIAKATATYLTASTSALTKCWEAVNDGKATGACPAADGKTVTAIAKAEVKKTATICKACGGPDKACDGTDDFTPSTIGFAATCPDVTPPGGTSCAATPASLADVVACVDCVAAFGASCALDAAVPGLGVYPAVCRP